MWKTKNNTLYKKFIFKDFDNAFEFMKQVAVIAKKINHHPRWANEWNIVEFWLSTHEKGDMVSEKDIDLAKLIDEIYIDNSIHENPNNSLPGLKIYTDGGSRGNPGPSASGYVIFDDKDNIIFKKGVYLGITTNNKAEYTALKLALEKALEYSPKTINIFMDSLLIINQMKGIYKIKNEDLLIIYKEIREILKKVENKTFTHVPRALNKIADAEVNAALDKALA